MRTDLTEPQDGITGTKQCFLAYLDYYRSVVASKLDGMSDADLTTSRVPSGWSPIELLKHLVYMERRWLVWGFLGEDVPDPWGDDDEQGRWSVVGADTIETLLERLESGGAQTRAIVEAAELLDRGSLGGRFDEEPAPTLEWILFHVLQEYARHAGHLDVARELADGSVGENTADV